VLALRGSEGWVSQLKLAEYENEEVVGSTKGKGMVELISTNERLGI